MKELIQEYQADFGITRKYMVKLQQVINLKPGQKRRKKMLH
ncbi:hypothetical protein [Listeria booriae]|nr:hypothetical protein [Listeria booriae]